MDSDYQKFLIHREKARVRAKEWYSNNRERALKWARERYYKNRKLKGRPTGRKHHLWKGESVGYHALHAWVTRWRGRPRKCEVCKKDRKRMQWANIDHKYRRNLDDYMRVCTSCHRKYDYENGLSDKGSRYGSIKNKRGGE